MTMRLRDEVGVTFVCVKARCTALKSEEEVNEGKQR